jgi:hypothetical protein
MWEYFCIWRAIKGKTSTWILTNTDHPIGPYFTSPNKLDEYKPLFIRTAEYMGETQIDIRRIEKLSRYDRPPWKPLDAKQEPAANIIGRERPERLRKTMTNTSRYIRMDRSGIWYRQNRAYDQKKNPISNTVFSAEQSAIIRAIQSEKNNRHKKVIITDSLSKIMAAESRTPRTPRHELLERCWIMKDQDTEDQWTNINMKKNNGSPGKKMEKIIDYAKEIGLYNGI